MNRKGATTMTTVLLVVMTLVLIGFSLFTFLTERPKVEEDFKDVALLNDYYNQVLAIKFYFNQFSDEAAVKAYNELQQPGKELFADAASYEKFKEKFFFYYTEKIKQSDFDHILYYFEKGPDGSGNTQYMARLWAAEKNEAGEMVEPGNYIQKSLTSAQEKNLLIENGILSFKLENLGLKDFAYSKEGKIEENRFEYEPKIEYQLDLAKFEADLKFEGLIKERFKNTK